MQEKLGDSSIGVFSNDPLLRILIHAVTGIAARGDIRAPVWMLGNTVIANVATLSSTLNNSARNNIREKADMNSVADLGIKIKHGSISFS